MPHMDGTGPESKGSSTGRTLGSCSSQTETKILSKLGKGMGKRRKTGGGEGEKKRLQSGDKI